MPATIRNGKRALVFNVRVPRLKLLLGVALMLRFSSLKAGGPGQEQSADPDDDESYNDPNDCWTYGGWSSVGIEESRRSCCSFTPCGYRHCWAPPEFVYHFCCEEPACRPAVISHVQQALNAATAVLPNENASNIAFRISPESFRTILLRSFAYLRLEAGNDDQACPCAYAYASAALLFNPHGVHSKRADFAISPLWLAQGIKWVDLIALGWGGIFALLLYTVAERPNISHDFLRVPHDMSFETRDFEAFVDGEQHRAQRVFHEHCAGNGREACTLSEYAEHVHALGIWQNVWKRTMHDTLSRQLGRRCTVVSDGQGQGRWTQCKPWEYSPYADFGSPALEYTGRTEPLKDTHIIHNASAAVCVLGAPRTVLLTYNSIRLLLVEVVRGNTFLYVPFPDGLNIKLEMELKLVGPAVTAIATRDVNRAGMQQRIAHALQNQSRLLPLYKQTLGPWRAPLFDQMGSSMWGYFAQHVCRRMVESHEQQRLAMYEWVIFARADMFWNHWHPPLEMLDPRFVYVPYGQDNSHYDNGPGRGLNDRHAVVPRSLFRGYFGRWEQMSTGEAWRYLSVAAEAGYQINTEQYLLLHLHANGVRIRRFPPVSFLAGCVDGPQCQHLYRGTTLARRTWVSRAKYHTEAVEVRRTLFDDEFNIRRPSRGWIWTQLRPHQFIDTAPHADWEIHGVELVCCLTKSGPASCRRWPFGIRYCHCLV